VPFLGPAPLRRPRARRGGPVGHVLREHRGGAHLAAVRQAGLAPLEAIVAGSGGPVNATFFGWPEPFPEPTEELRTRLASAGAATDAQVAPAYAVLSADERAELPRLLAAAARSARRAA
jgi:hypothetical protein